MCRTGNGSILVAMDDIRDTFRRHGLVRSDERILGGVCAGVGRRLGLRPWPARWLFLLVLLLVPGSQLIIYPVLWILMPKDPAPVWTTSPAP